MVLDERPDEQLRRLAQQVARLRRDATVWQRAGRPDTAEELRTLIVILEGTVDLLRRDLFAPPRRRVPTLFDP